MKIIKLEAENVKRLRAVEITPTGAVVMLTGRNEQGKSSVLDAIWWALGGTAHVQGEPIRRGQKKARVKLDLGELTVERRFTSSGSTLVVENAKGEEQRSPQALLDALVGALSFDPLAFMRKGEREQHEILRALLAVGIDWQASVDAERAAYDERTELNREVKGFEGRLAAIPLEEKLPALELEAAMAAVTKAAEDNAAAERELSRRRIETEKWTRLLEEAEGIEREAREKDEEAARLVNEAEANRQMAAFKRKQSTDIDAAIKKLPSVHKRDVAALQQRVTEQQALERRHEKQADRAELAAQLASAEKKARKLTQAIEDHQGERAEALAAAKMPVDGLSLSADGVLYQGLPFDQASDAAQLRVSTAIAMALNPKLRVLRIREGSVLDADNLAVLAEMAAANDFQVWLEVVGTADGKVGVVIEDGAVAAVDGEPVQEELSI